MIIALALALALQTTTPTPVKETYEHKLLAQLDKTNEALAVYYATPCDSKELAKTEMAFWDENDALKKLFEAQPEDQEPSAKIREIEIVAGYMFYAKKFIDGKCAKES